MKVEGLLFLFSAAFFAVVDVVYWFTSYDPTGTTALGISVGLAFLTGFYVLFTGRRLPRRRPEDNPEADISEGAGEIGFFSPHSWWPLITGLAAAVAAFGVAVGSWLFLIWMLFVVLSSIGVVFEYYRGVYAH